MIKLRKKTLSVLLCLTLLASVIVVGFVTPAMALTSTATTPSNRKVQISFDNYATGDFTTLYKTNGTATIVADGTDKYLNITAAAANDRVAFDGMNILKSDKKYYIAFDAKSDNGATFNLTMGSPSSGFRIMFEHTTEMNHKQALADSGSKFYVEGTEVANYDAFNAGLSSEWQSFGFVLSLDTSVWDNRVRTDTATKTYFNYGASKANNWYNNEKTTEEGGYNGNFLLLGAGGGANKSVCYDNIVIYEMDVYDDAVPQIQYGTQEVTKVTTEFETDVEGITASDVWVYGTFGTNVGTEDLSGSQDAVESAHGNTIKFIDNAYTRHFAFKNAAKFDTIGAKYKVTFDVKSTQSSNVNFVLNLGNNKNISGWQTNAFSISTTSGVTQAAIDNGFKFYIDGSEVAPADFKIQNKNLGWHTYSIEFTYTDALYNADVAATTDPRNLWIVAIRGYLDNYKVEAITTETIEVGNDAGETYISNRNHQDNPFVSAGLRFMNSLPTTTVEAAEEIGFVVAPSTLAAKAENKDNWYKLDGGVNSIARKAVCKDAANGINIVYDTDETRTYYQLVLTGLSTENEANTAYSRRFSTVMYVKKDGVYSYYALGEASYNQVDAIAYVLGIKNY